VTEKAKIEGILDELRSWPSMERLRLARMILEAQRESVPPRQGSLKDLLGALKTDAPLPTEEECRVILQEELSKKHLK
jgi:hypothetical protein